MPFCRKCGAKLEENERFCHICGTPVAPVTASAPPKRGRPYVLPVVILLAVLLAAMAFSALVFVPLNPVDFNQTNQVAKEEGVNSLVLNLQADIADVNVIPQHLGDKVLFLNVSATGSTGLFGSTQPVQVAFDNVTANGSTVVTSQVSSVGVFPFSYNLRVVCAVYVDPSVRLKLTVRSNVGKIAIDTRVPLTLDGLYFQATTGSVEANLTRGVVIAGGLSLMTTTGSVRFSMDRADVSGNVSATVQSTTGSVNVDVTENQKLSGNLTLDAETTTGSVNLAMVIRDDVGARIESSTSFGGTTVDVQHFSGNQPPIESDNYPAGSNFIVNLKTTTGGININAAYEPGAVRT